MPLSYGYLMDMLWISFGKGSITTRKRIEDGLKMDWKRMEDGGKRAVRSGFYRGNIEVLSWLIVKRWSCRLSKTNIFFRQQLPKIIKNFLKPRTRRYALFKNQGKDCSLPWFWIVLSSDYELAHGNREHRTLISPLRLAGCTSSRRGGWALRR